jgi:hypothetical protein
MTTKGFQGVVPFNPDEKEHRRQIAQAVNQQLTGKLNAVMQITLTPGATTTALKDSRISFGTYIGFSPLSANAAGAVSSLWVSDQVNGQATLHHANTATTDRTFNVLLIG